MLRDGAEVLVPVAELRPGDRFVVRPGEKIATDGIVEEGESALDQSMLTGESAPVEIEPGADVVGGTINTYGRLIVRTTKVGGNTALAQIARLVADAQSGKAPVQRIADRISAVFVPIVIGISLATLAGGSWRPGTHRRLSPPRSPCSSSPARARSVSRLRLRSWSGRAAARSSGS